MGVGSISCNRDKLFFNFDMFPKKRHTFYSLCSLTIDEREYPSFGPVVNVLK